MIETDWKKNATLAFKEINEKIQLNEEQTENCQEIIDAVKGILLPNGQASGYGFVVKKQKGKGWKIIYK